jgi:hypothetical protein
VEWEENRGFEILDVGFVWTLLFFFALRRWRLDCEGLAFLCKHRKAELGF